MHASRMACGYQEHARGRLSVVDDYMYLKPKREVNRQLPASQEAVICWAVLQGLHNHKWGEVLTFQQS